MSAPANGPEPTRRHLAHSGYGTTSPELLARADRGLSRFVGDQDEDQGRESTVDGAEA